MNDLLRRYKEYFYDNKLNEVSCGNDTAARLLLEDDSEAIPIYHKWIEVSYTNKSLEDDYLSEKYDEFRKIKVLKYKKEILALIIKDEFIDGDLSKAEEYMLREFRDQTRPFILDAINDLYVDYIDNSHVLVGILSMLSSVSYDAITAQGITMAVALLSSKDLEVRDKAIQSFERWNSKKGIKVLRNIKCSPIWLQGYVDKVIEYLERDGID